MDKKRLILFVGVYDTLDIFTYELKKAFDELGYETILYDSRDSDGSLMRLAEFVQKPVTAALTFNNLGFNMELTKGRNIWEDLGIPCINILMDHPFCYKNALDNAPFNGIVLCPDRNHMRYLNRFYPNISVTGFLPHAGKQLPGEKKLLSERTIDVMYAGNLSKSFVDNIIPDLSKYRDFFDVEALCHQIYEDVIANPYKTTEQGIEDALCSIDIHVDDDVLCQIIADLHFLDLYIVSYYRERAVASIAKAGIKLDLFGAGWDKCDWIKLPNVNYHGKVSADEVVVHMQNAKFVLSTMTWFKDGTHDRVFNGMLQGAVACTDSSVYMLEAFNGKIGEGGINESGIDERELIIFELSQLDELANSVKELLGDLDKAQQIADRGYKRAMATESWEARALELDRDLISQLID